jgi:hypothetical protein
MAEITRLPFVSHLRAESSVHVVFDSGGRRVAAGRGLQFWFLPMRASVAELPADDRDLGLLFSSRTRDFQEVSVQGVVTWRVADADKLASRVDFTVDLRTGKWLKQPLDVVAQRVVELAQQEAHEWLGGVDTREALSAGVDAIRTRVTERLRTDPSLVEMGVALVGARISAVRPTAEVERALQTPTREAIQGEADRATSERRATAVERERAIAENELHNQIALAKREEELIARRGQNEIRRVTEEAEAGRIRSEGEAARAKIGSASQAEAIRTVESARAETERERVGIYRDLEPHVIVGLALHELAEHLPTIEHLTLTPELVGPALGRIADQWARR